jgi:hypothetical protein
VFAATSLGIMGGSFVSSRLNTLNVAPGSPLMLGLALAAVTTMLLLLMTLAGWMPLPVVIPQLVLANVAFGLIMPNAMERAMQPLPQIAGAAGSCYRLHSDGDGRGGQWIGGYALRWPLGSLNDRFDGPVLAVGAGWLPVGRPTRAERCANLSSIALLSIIG